MILLTSAVISAIVSGLVALLVSERRLAAENVIQERMKWRDKIRDLALEMNKARGAAGQNAAEVGELRARLALQLNPHDPEDQHILTLIAPNQTGGTEEFTQRLALLLKHDWERAKYEASLWQRLSQRPPVRVRFADCRPGDEHAYRVSRRFWR